MMDRKTTVLAALAAFGLGAEALTVEKMFHVEGNYVVADLAYEAASADRNVLVAWDAADRGASYASWGSVEHARGVAGAGSTACRVTLPPEAATAGRVRFFLVDAADDVPGYIRSTGQQMIITDFFPTPKCKIVADYQWEDTTTTQQRVFGVSGAGLTVHHYINGSGGLSWSCSNGGNWTALDNTKFLADRARAVFTLDAKNDRTTLVKNGVTVFDKGMKAQNSAAPGTGSSTHPLNIFATGLATDKYGALRLYSLECHTDGVLKQRFVPHLSGGAAVLRDTVTGKCYESIIHSYLWAGAPATSLTPSDTSDAADPVALAAAFTVVSRAGSSDGCGSVDLSFAASSAARDIWCAWDDSDKGDAFGAWAHNERLAAIPSGATTARCILPPGAAGAKAVRYFILAGGGSYACSYVRSDGRQAVDTGIPTGTGMAVSVDLVPYNCNAVQQRAFGINDSSTSLVMASYINGGGAWAWAARDKTGNWTASTIYPESKPTTISLDVPNDRYAIAVDGKQVYTRTISSVVAADLRTIERSTVTLGVLGAKNSNGTFSNCAHAELYGATVTTNGVAARRLSAWVQDGVPGMKDAVTGAFFGNAVTNGYTQFVPGGRTDAPAALAVAAEAAEGPSARNADVFADVKFWMRGLAEDANADGVVQKDELRDALGRVSIGSPNVFGTESTFPRYTNEFVRMPGRDAGRMMRTLYFPQDIVITNEAAGKGYAYTSALGLGDAANGIGNRYTILLRAKADMATAPTQGSQWILKFGHTSKQGIMLGMSGSDPNYRWLQVYSTGAGVTNAYSGLVTVTNAWFDLAFVADGQRFTVMMSRDGQALTGTNGDKQVGTIVKTANLGPNHNLAPAANTFYLGAESPANGKHVYPMGTNDNGIKAFRGSIQQLAVWDRALTQAEVFEAMGWPRTDLWRVGVVDGRADEFRGLAPAEGVDVDAEEWAIQDGVARGKPVTFRFPLVENYETRCAQLFRWKSLPGSASGTLELTLNGKSLGRKPARAGQWSQWYVPAESLQAGTNTAVLARVDTGAGAVRADAVMLGGGIQVGKADKGYSDYVQETIGLQHLYAADGNLHDVRRVLYCQKTAGSNMWFHVNVPAEMAHDRQRWRFTFATSSGSRATGVTTHPISIDLNGACLGTKAMGNNQTWTIDLAASDVLPGENVFNFRNNEPNTGAHYTGIDYFALEPLRPVDGTIMFLR